MKKQNKAKWYLPVLAILAVLLVVVAVTQGSRSSAKYTMEKKADLDAVADEFYFESDLLNGGTYELPAGTDTITFQLRNHPDDARVAQCDIDYKIQLELNGAQVASQSGTLTADTAQDKQIELKSLSAGTYKVTAKAVSPYVAELSATFVIPEENRKVSYTVTDAPNSPVATVTVSTVDYEGAVTIRWTDDVYPDNTDEKMRTATNSVTVEFDKNSEYTFLFFKKNPKTQITNNNAVFTFTPNT